MVYVSPQGGGRAASAGLFVTLGAHIAAMAPNTRIGASSPINSDGSAIPEPLNSKIKNDLKAQVDDLCNHHLNVKGCTTLAESAISAASSYPVEAAVQQGLVDLESNSLADLLNQSAPKGIDGWQVKLSSGKTVTLETAGVAQQTIQPGFADGVLGFLLDPNIAFILLILAGIGIYLEISHPGAIVPGVVGAIALVLFLFAAGSLSVNFAGLLLVGVGFVLLILDVRLPSHGVLTVGALIALVLGSLLVLMIGTYWRAYAQPVGGGCDDDGGGCDSWGGAAGRHPLPAAACDHWHRINDWQSCQRDGPVGALRPGRA